MLVQDIEYEMHCYHDNPMQAHRAAVMRILTDIKSASLCAGVTFFYKLIILLSCTFWVHSGHAVNVGSHNKPMTCAQEYTLYSDVADNLPVLDFFQQFQNDIEGDKAQVIPKAPKRCLVSQKDLKKIKQRVLVDVRSKKTFGEGTIAGSINLPEQHLSTRSFLKNKAVVLVGNSYSYSELFTYCTTLKQRGFRSVYVLDGGYTAPATSDIQSIDARQFFAAKRKHLWLTIVFSDQEPFNDSSLENKNLVVISASMSHEQALQKISEQFLTLNTSSDVQANILIINLQGLHEKELQQYIDVDFRAYTYVLEGGFDAYNTFAQKNTAMINKKRQLAGSQHYGCGG